MTERLRGVDLPRPEPAADKGPLDTRFYDLVEARVRRVFADNPVYASVLRHPHRGPPAGRRQPRRRPRRRSPTDRAHLAKVEALDPDGAVAGGAVRARPRGPQPPPVAVRCRRGPPAGSAPATAAGDLGDALFLLFARGAAAARRAPGAHHRPARGGPRVPRRLATRGSSARQVADLAGGRARATRRTCPACSARCARRPRTSLAPAELARLRRAIATANTLPRRLRRLAARGRSRRATDDWPLGREPYDELVRLRAFGDLDTDAILRDRLRSSCVTQPRGAPRRGPRARPRRRRPHRHRAPQVRPPGDVRRRRSTATAT